MPVTNKRNRGFSIVELIAVIGILGILASVSIGIVGNVNQNTKNSKLSSDTKTLNRAIMAYRASGGSFNGSETAATVLAKLRSHASSADTGKAPGFTGSFMDRRVAIKAQTQSEAASDNARVYWDGTSQVFLLAYSGSEAGVGEFYLDDDLAEIEGGSEDRESVLSYSGSDGWIWDYDDTGLPPAVGPNTVGVTVIDPNAMPSTPTDPVVPPVVVPPGSHLLAPVFSLPGGEYSISTYDLAISLNNPNPSGASELFYAVNYGAWKAYTGSFSTHPDDIVSTQAVSISTDYSDSPKNNQVYTASPVKLSPPIIDPDRENFGFFTGRKVKVTLLDTNKKGTAEIRYSLNGGKWKTYKKKLKLKRSDYPDGVQIVAKSIPVKGADYYISSVETKRFLSTGSIDLVGEAIGSFQDPVGLPGMVSNLSGSESSTYFEWGDDSYPFNPAIEATLSKSSLDYSGTSFSSITAGQRFQVGEFDYYNGRVLADTGADKISLSIGLSLDIENQIYNPYFDFDFDLINTVNYEDPSNPWQDADYVLLDDPTSSRTLIINDFEFEFRLEFGDASQDGFALFDEFHVLEQKSASVNVYGTFIEIGAVESASSDVVSQNSDYVDGEQAANEAPLAP